MKKSKHSGLSYAQVQDRVRHIQSMLDSNRGLSSSVTQSIREESSDVIRHVIRRTRDTPISRTLLGNTRSDSPVGVCSMPFGSKGHGLVTDLRWLHLMLGEYAAYINEFIRLHNNFMTEVFSGDSRAAEQRLQETIEHAGWSLWTIRDKALMLRRDDSIDASLQLFREFNRGHAIVNIISLLYSERFRLEPSDFDKFANALIGVLAKHPDVISFLGLHFGRLDWVTPESLSDALSWNDGFTIIDRYFTYVALLEYIVLVDFHAIGHTQLSALLNEACETFSDQRFTNLNRLLVPQRTKCVTSATQQLLDVADQYTLGRYDDVVALCTAQLPTSPLSLERYEFFASALLQSRREFAEVGPSTSLTNRVARSIYDILDKNEQSGAAEQFLHRLAYLLGAGRFSNQLLAFLSRTSQNPISVWHKHTDASTASCATPRLALSISPQGRAHEYLETLSRSYGESATTVLFKRVLEGRALPLDDSPLSRLPASRRLIYDAKAFIRSNRLRDAIPLLVDAISRHGDVTPTLVAASKDLCQCYMSERMYSEAIALLVSVHFRRPRALGAQAVAQVVNAVTQLPRVPSSSELDWAILFNIYYSTHRSATNARVLYVAYASFLESQQLSRPSELLTQIDRFPLQRLIFFLRHVCVPEVMDGSYEFTSSHDLHTERITLCQFLINADAANKSQYADEMSRLALVDLTADAMRQADRSKVFVDTAGIKRSLDKRLMDQFDRLSAMSRLTDVDLRVIAHALEMLSKSENASVQFIELTFQSFRKLFGELRDRFLYGDEYGLDSYLSVRIRHNIFPGEVWGLFDGDKLVTRRSDGQYLRNDYWHEALGVDSAEAAEVCDTAFAQLSQSVERCIADVTESWVQIYDPLRHPGSLLNFDYTDAQMLEVMAKVSTKSTFEDFVEGVFAELRMRTDSNLERIRAMILGPWSSHLSEAVIQLEQQIVQVVPSWRTVDFRQVLAQFRPKLQNEIAKLADWFTIADVMSMTPFTFEQLTNGVVALMQKCYPNRTIAPHLDIDVARQLKGATFMHFWDLLFIALDNVYKHAGAETPSVRILASMSDTRLSISISNSLRDGQDCAELERRLKELHEQEQSGLALGAIRREGGSGFFKMHKIVRYDLLRDDDYFISWSVPAEGVFMVEVDMGLGGLVG